MKRQNDSWSYGFTVVAAIMLFHTGHAMAATPTQGAILGQVRDLDSGQPVAGVTVVASGPEGDIATLTDAMGSYQLRALPIGHYAIRFHRDEVMAERDATVSVDKVVRVNIRLPAKPSETETTAVAYAPSAIDIGSSRIGTTFGADFIDSVPNRGADVASMIEKTPGAYRDDVGLSLSGGTGADNAYYIEGLNVTALRDGLLGTNLKVAFLEEAEVISAGYGAEYGRALGGVVNMTLKSGTNTWKGSAFSWMEPGWMAGSPRRVLSWATVLSRTVEPDHTTQVGLEVGGPLIKNSLFLWVGYAPEIARSHFVQYTDRFVDRDGDGLPDSNANGSPMVESLFTRRIPQETTTHNYAGKITWRARPEHVLNLSLVGVRKDEEFMRGANYDLLAGMSHEKTNRQDIIAHWQSVFFQRKWRIDATLGIHSENYWRHSPFGDAESMNDNVWQNSPSLSQFNPTLSPYCTIDEASGFNNCPVMGYQSGGYGMLREVSAFRLGGQIKSTNVFTAAGLHELKYGFDYEFIQYNDKHWNSGIDGSRGSAWNYSTGPTRPDGSPEYESDVFTLFRLPNGATMPDPDNANVLLQSPYYQDSIRATVRAFNYGAFIQESFLPLPNLTVNVGFRWEAQRFTDSQGNKAFGIYDSFAPRIGVIYDPTKEGRSKVFANYSQYYESIPMDIAVRPFGGEGILVSVYDPSCSTPNWGSCQPVNAEVVSGQRLKIQSNLKGSYNNEVVMGGQYQPLHSLVVGASVIYRWLGRAVEDIGGTIESGTGPTTLGNPTDPKPERTYKAIQLTANKLLAKRWFFAGSYTYSRTMGNYSGLYSANTNSLSPNITAQYDVSDLMKNRYGPLPNDRPHIIHLDGYYQFVRGRHLFVPGLGFVGQSGVPITPLGRGPMAGENETFILPRGSEGRTPFVTQLDFHFSYRTKISKVLSAEAFCDIFNILNQKTTLAVDNVYTVDTVLPADKGTTLSQIPLVDRGGKPKCTAGDTDPSCFASKNPNYRQPTAYQAPISGRLGLRVWF